MVVNNKAKQVHLFFSKFGKFQRLWWRQKIKNFGSLSFKSNILNTCLGSP